MPWLLGRILMRLASQIRKIWHKCPQDMRSWLPRHWLTYSYVWKNECISQINPSELLFLNVRVSLVFTIWFLQQSENETQFILLIWLLFSCYEFALSKSMNNDRIAILDDNKIEIESRLFLYRLKRSMMAATFTWIILLRLCWCPSEEEVIIVNSIGQRMLCARASKDIEFQIITIDFFFKLFSCKYNATASAWSMDRRSIAADWAVITVKEFMLFLSFASFEPMQLLFTEA